MESRRRIYKKRNQTEYTVAKIVDIGYAETGRASEYEFTTKDGQVIHEKGMKYIRRRDVLRFVSAVGVYYDPDNPRLFSVANGKDSASIGFYMKIVLIPMIILLIIELNVVNL